MNGISIPNGFIHRGRKEESIDDFQIPEEHELEHTNLEDSKEWITQSDLSVQNLQGNYTTGSIVNGRRSSSSQRRPGSPGTASSQGRAGLSVGMGSTGSGFGGSVRKRFSMLKLGKKASTVGSGLSGGVEEE